MVAVDRSEQQDDTRSAQSTHVDAAAWASTLEEAFARAGSSPRGLTSETARSRAARPGARSWRERFVSGDAFVLARQLANPLTLLLLVATVVALLAGDRVDALIILVIVLGSALMGFVQERGARRAIRRLRALVEVKASVVRDGREQEIPARDVVPGDIVLVAAGDAIPGDARVVESDGLLVDESPLTGESFPAEKQPGVLAAETVLARRSNMLHAGTHVVAGRGRALVLEVGPGTQMGQLAAHLGSSPPVTDFEHGVRRLGYLLLQTTVFLTVGIFAINVYLARPVLESLLFALALAVGLTPELLPAILTVNLSHGARKMAERKVVVKRLASIENLGSMSVLCSDKTGTLTLGVVDVHAALDAEGQPSARVRELARLNAYFQTGYRNPTDDAILREGQPDSARWKKLGEAPYDFARKRLSVALESASERVLVTKGAFRGVLAVCDRVEADGSIVELDDVRRAQIVARYQDASAAGQRLIAVAWRTLPLEVPDRLATAEEGLTLAGYVVLSDVVKPTATAAIASLARVNVELKIITGDNATIARATARAVGLEEADPITGADIDKLDDVALAARARDACVFAEVEPAHKERIVRALRKGGAVVGYLGDGLNDAPALQAADVGISVDLAVDVAKDAADIVLLEKDLGVLAEGVREGRRTFANTLKYVYMATSSNFGNMFSMAIASLFFPFLPLLPSQILLLNVLNDLPEMAIATDRVDEAQLETPRRWDVASIRRFMLFFGPLSSLFDAATFVVLLVALHDGASAFRSGWFIESLASSALVVLVIRTRGSPLRSMPGRALLVATLGIAAVAVLLPFSPLRDLLGFERPSLVATLAVLMIVAAYLVASEMMKRWAYRRADARVPRAPR